MQNSLETTIIPEMGNISVLDIAIRERGEDPLHRINIKACGWVGKKGTNDKKKIYRSVLSFI